MRKTRGIGIPALLAVTLLCWAGAVLGQTAAPVKLEDVIAGHLSSIGDAATRAAAKTRVFEASTQFKVLTGGSGQMTDGRTVIVSDGHKVQLMMKFPTSNYHGERFICDGKKVSVAVSTDAQKRSNFGNFIYIQDVVLREGLLGGALTTAWPLLDLERRRPRLTYDGLKTTDGRQLYEVRYIPSKGQDVEIWLYFDPESFHHVLTVYSLSIQAQLAQGGQLGGLAMPELGGKPGSLQGTVSPDAAQASAQQQTRFRIEERFSEFRTADGLTLPTRYNIHFSQEIQGGNTTILAWDSSGTRILQNVSLDARNFEVK